MRRIAFALATFLAVPAIAQTPPAADPAVASARQIWEGMTNFIIKSAEQMPEGDYSYRPVATVRTFGQLIGHVAGAQYVYCSAVLGDPPRSEGSIEETVRTKAGLVAAIKASTEYCKTAYALNGAALSGSIKLFGSDRSRLFALIQNGAHNAEHYGNIVTYLRVKGMVPPSSQPRPGG